jgi:hypothetical protein
MNLEHVSIARPLHAIVDATARDRGIVSVGHRKRERSLRNVAANLRPGVPAVAGYPVGKPGLAAITALPFP